MPTKIFEKNFPSLGERLKEERKAIGFSNRTALEDSLEVTSKTIANWESGASHPNAGHLLKLADMGFDIGYIMFGVRHAISNQGTAESGRPAARIGAEITRLELSSDDAERLLDLAKRLALRP